MKQPIIAPSVLSANFANLENDFRWLNESVAEYIHIDVMDGVFVPNLSMGIPVIKAMRKLSAKTFDVHLMIVEPDKYVDAFKSAGAEILSVHYEACTHLHRTLQKIKAAGMKAGIAINPHTPAELLSEVIQDTDHVIVMSVNPGFGGQSFIENTYAKVTRLKELIIQKNAQTQIEIDGGVTLDNARRLVTCGADILVAGHTVFSSPDPKETIRQLKNII